MYNPIRRRRLREMIQKHSDAETSPDFREMSQAGLSDVLRVCHLMVKTQSSGIGRYMTNVETVDVEVHFYTDQSMFRLQMHATGVWLVTVRFTPEALTDFIFDDDNDFHQATA